MKLYFIIIIVLFKDRTDAGKKLADLVYNKKIKSALVVSLLRGGIIVGQEIARKLKIPHLPLAVAKIPAPFQSELAIGALCFDFIYLEKRIIDSLNIDKQKIKKQIDIAKNKFSLYLKKFNLKESNYNLKNKTIILVDDGIATGSTVKAALLFIKSKKPKKIILASPVAPNDFVNPGFNEVLIFYQNAVFSSVSQFFKEFPQVQDEEIKRLLY